MTYNIQEYSDALLAFKTSSSGRDFLQRKRLPKPCSETKKVQDVYFNFSGNKIKTKDWIKNHFNLSSKDASVYFHKLLKTGRP